MKDLEGKKVQATLDKETVELEEKYQKQNADFELNRSATMRELYKQYLKTLIVEKK